MGKSNRALVTGLFLITLIATTTIAIFWIGHLERQRSLYVVSTNASVSGLNPESTVFFRGIPVGKVARIEFDSNKAGTILVTIEIDNNIILTKSVYATLHLKGVTGLTQLELEDPNKTQERLPAGNNLNFRIPLRPSITDKLFDSGEVLLRKADHLMMRFSAILNDENEKNIGGILSNLNNLTDKLATLQKSVDTALIDIPKLSANANTTLTHFDQLAVDTRKSLSHVDQLSLDASKSLAHINQLTNDLHNLSKDVKILSHKAGDFIDSSKDTGAIISQTTLPQANALLTELQSTSQQIKRIATMLENNPQALLLGPKQQTPGPGEPGYENTQ